MANFNKLLQSIISLGNDGKAFEVFCKWFLENDPFWKTQVEQVWLWDDWPERWGPDCGIDLIFVDKSGSKWAVQAKCYAAHNSISKRDMDSFLSESNRPIIDKRLLLSSTDLIGFNAIRTCQQQEKPVIRFMKKDFEAAGLVYPDHFSELGKRNIKPEIQKRPYQQEAINTVEESFKTYSRGQLIMACGTGKTLVSLLIKEKLNSKTTLALSPSLSLLSQTLLEWTKNCSEQFNVLCVCSDTSVGLKERQEDTKTTEVPFPVTSDTQEIRRFLNRNGPKVIFSTYQSSELIGQAQGNSIFDLMIADEAHRCTGLANTMFTHILEDNNIQAHKRLFMTATPRVFSQKVSKTAVDRGEIMHGMDDSEIFGPEIYRYTFGMAIEEGWLSDYQVMVVLVDEPMVKQLIDDHQFVSLEGDEATNAKSLASKIGLIKAIKEYKLKRIISFHNKVSNAKNFSTEFTEVVSSLGSSAQPTGNIWTGFVSGEMNAGERKRKLDKLKDLGSHDIGILSNARCLSEGVDVPELDGIAFIDPKASQIDIIQAVGRAIRLSKNKEKSTIVVPVFVDNSDDAQVSIEQSRFKPIWDVLKALRSHDEVLAQELDQCRIEMAKPGFENIKDQFNKINIDVPVRVDSQFTKAIKTLLVEQTTTTWEYWYGLLENYVERWGHTRVPPTYEIDGNKLGQWLSRQRSNQEQLPPHRRERLEKLKYWTWDPRKFHWQEGYNYIVKYYEEHGHYDIASTKKITGLYLLDWVTEQKKSYKNNSLDKDQIERLESLEGWTWGKSGLAHTKSLGLNDVKIPEKWKIFYDKLKQFSNKYSTSITLKQFDRPLHKWRLEQCSKRFDLSANQRELLENLPHWNWDKSKSGNNPIELKNKGAFQSNKPKIFSSALKNKDKKDNEWVKKYIHAKRLLSQGGLLKGRKHKEIRTWLHHQRKKWQKLNENQRKALLNLDTRISFIDEEMRRKSKVELVTLESLSESTELFKKHYPEVISEENEWVMNYKLVIKELIKIIENSKEGQKTLKDLTSYLENSHRKIISKDFVSVGKWVYSQQRKMDQLNLSKLRILDAIPGWLWHTKGTDFLFELGYRYLKKYDTQGGSIKDINKDLIFDKFKLGLWMQNILRKNSLSNTQIARLNKLRGWKGGKD